MLGAKDKVLPISMVISFDKLLKQYDAMAKSEDPFKANRAKQILEAQAPYPFLREGFTDLSLLEKHEDIIKIILQDTFTDVLSENEIKTASLPYYDLVFNSSRRFQKIIKEAGPDFKLKLRHMGDGIDYIMAATVILSYYYGFNLDFKRPNFYDIPDSSGIMNHYRVLYNADYLEILPTDKAKKLSEKDVDDLLADSDNLELWKEKIPPDSFVSKGFVISNMFDVTAEQSISEIKSELIASDKRGSDTFMDDLQETFRSLFKIKDLRVGFSTYNRAQDRFEKVHGNGIESFILKEKENEACDMVLCASSYNKLLNTQSYFSIADVERFYKLSKQQEPYKGLHEQGIGSAIFAPIASEGELLGVLELVSDGKNRLNGVNASKLDDVMPYIVSAVVRSKIEEENLIDAIIQNECTSMHPSVRWRFQEEARKFIMDEFQGKQPAFGEIVFNDVHPLYGQIDIRGSSAARNKAVQRDLMIQLSEIEELLKAGYKVEKLPIYQELMFRVNNLIDSIKDTIYSNSEQLIFDFIQEEVNPVLKHLRSLNDQMESKVTQYESQIDPGTKSYYDHRKNYDQSVMEINNNLVALLDRRQEEAQEMFPHYFERYKTDGIEHDLYIGDSISGERDYNPLYLNNLRLWQLQVMCEMENAYYNLKPNLPVKLDVASLMLVYSTSLSIRFRMDEKQFDVDGTYNARYEIIKKRIDKSYIKGTNERLTQKGKLSIVYSQRKEEQEYLRYISFLKAKGYFTNNIEIVELEGLQGVTGLKAIRAEILYTKGEAKEKTYTYADLMQELET